MNNSVIKLILGIPEQKNVIILEVYDIIKENKKCKNENCNNDVLWRLGYEDLCHYCVREKFMKMSDEELADNLTAYVFAHEKHWELYEAIRRILLRKKQMNKMNEKTYLKKIRKIVKYWFAFKCPECGGDVSTLSKKTHIAYKCIECGLELAMNRSFNYITKIDNLAKEGLKCHNKTDA